MSEVLAGVRVLEVAQWWFVPAAGAVLAEACLPRLPRADGGDFTLVASPVQFDERSPTITPAPDLGQHTEKVLLALGLDWDELAACREASAIG
jgi:crotonobetainyl-CoA:carnitine CoA-transferase CaiB-like acyl-CoA transferase